MGQYWKPVNLDKKESISPWQIGNNGAKLTEHSWRENDLLRLIVYLLSPAGHWHKTKLVWTGDYDEPGQKFKEYEAGEGKNLYSSVADEEEPDLPYKRIIPVVGDHPEIPFIVNHDQKVFVNLNTLPDSSDHPDWEGWKLHPLSLLTAHSTGGGGGDYHYENPHYGTWAGDCISSEYEIPENYTELKPDFREI